MVLYTLLQLAGVKAVDSMYEAFGKLAVTLGGIKRFRQHDCTCPDHLEYHTDHYAAYTGLFLQLGTGLSRSSLARLIRWSASPARYDKASRGWSATLSFSKKRSPHIGASRYFLCDYNLTKCAALLE